jgi:hypothetical protein
MSELCFLIFGDVVGRIGREALLRRLPALREKHRPDLVIANAENLAHGKGVTAKILREMTGGGVDLLTSGNHVFNNPGVHEIWSDPDLKDRLIRPANYPAGTAGDGQKRLEVGEKTVLVVNLLCQVFMPDDVESPFLAIDRILAEQERRPDAVLVDLHGEATSERVAFGLHVDGRVSAVTGTHTHVPTADARVLPNGTAYLTDVGMTGARHSVLGVAPEGPLSRFLTGEKRAFEIPTEGPADLNAVVVKIDAGTGRAASIEPIREIVE